MTDRPVVTRRRLLAACAGATTSAAGGCLDRTNDEPPAGTESTDADPENGDSSESGGGGDGTDDEDGRDGSTEDGTGDPPETDDSTDGPNDDPADRRLESAFDCADASRPTPDVEAGVEHEFESGDEVHTVESIGGVGYPEPPEASDDRALLEYVESHETAYRQNALATTYGTRLVGFGPGDSDRRLVKRRDGTAFVRIEYFYSASTYDEDVSEVEALDSAETVATYAVSEWGVARAEATGVDAGTGLDPHPIADGELVACFE